jgi:N6-adenosine-specific RNA methylase IME4
MWEWLEWKGDTTADDYWFWGCVADGSTASTAAAADAYDLILLDGHNRYDICMRHDLRFGVVEKQFASRVDAMVWMIDNQKSRRNLSTYQESILGIKRADLLKPQAKANQGTRTDLSANSSESVTPIDTRKAAADYAGVAESTISRVKYVEEHGEEEVKKAANRGEISTNDAYTQTKRKETKAKNETLKAQAALIPPPVGKFKTIIVDPPWEMEKVGREVRPNQAGFDYPTMSLDEIKAVDIPAADDAHLYLWTTQKYLPAAFDVLAAWGFKYLVTMVWHKPGGFQPFGLPQYNCEFVLIGRKGGLAFEDTKAFPTCFQAPRREHSRKPDEFFDLVRRVSPGPRMDLFAREPRDGFDVWGVEAGKFGGAA